MRSIEIYAIAYNFLSFSRSDVLLIDASEEDGWEDDAPSEDDLEEGEIVDEDVKEKTEEIKNWVNYRNQAYIVDFQGFQFDTTPFMPKEISVVDCRFGSEILHLFLDPPIPYHF